MLSVCFARNVGETPLWLFVLAVITSPFLKAVQDDLLKRAIAKGNSLKENELNQKIESVSAENQKLTIQVKSIKGVSGMLQSEVKILKDKQSKLVKKRNQLERENTSLKVEVAEKSKV